MTKVESLDALKQMRERLRSDMNIRENSNHPEDLPQIRISMGTCGIAAGAKEVMSRFISELRARNVDAVVTQTDCMDHCEAEPTVEITLPGREPVLYGDVTPDRVAAIIDKYIRNGQPAEGIIATGPSTAV